MGTSNEEVWRVNPPGAVVFAKEKPDGPLPSHVRLLIVPSETKWNDFNLKVHARFIVAPAGEEQDWLDGYLAFKGFDHNLDYFGSGPNISGGLIEPHEIRVPFATMLASAGDYLKLVSQLGGELALSVAEGINDVSLLQAREQAIPNWNEFFEGAEFATAFMRGSESGFALKAGAIILRGQRLDTVDARCDFNARVSLGQDMAGFSFTFKEAGPVDERRMAVLIGQNGSGKTASLVAIASALHDKGGATARLEPFPAFNRVVVFAHSRALELFRAAAQEWDSDHIYSLDPQGDVEGLDFTNQIISMARGAETVDRPLRRLNKLLDQHMPDLQLMVPIKDGGRERSVEYLGVFWAPLSSFPLKSNEQRRLMDVGNIDPFRRLVVLDRKFQLRALSLGQRTFLTFAIQAIHAALPASIFLIDEPENFLHPNLLSQFVRLLGDILKTTNSIAIVSTHSPFIVREVHQDQVYVLARDEDGGVNVDRPRLKTLGANVSDISNDIFGDDLADHLFERRVVKLFRETTDKQALLEMLQSEVSLEILMRVRELMKSDTAPDALSIFLDEDANL